jgi:F-type H+-transporting ATPase subunit delta
MAESELTTIARPYARAAFSQGLDETSGLATWSRMLEMLSATIQNDTVRSTLENPLLTRQQQSVLVIDIMGDELNDKGRNFVTVLAENDRISVMATISEIFETLKANHEKTMDVQITSAFEMSEEDGNKLSAALKSRLKREVNLTTSVDPTLIGGIVVRTQDTVIDNSVRGKLDRLAQVLS